MSFIKARTGVGGWMPGASVWEVPVTAVLPQKCTPHHPDARGKLNLSDIRKTWQHDRHQCLKKLDVGPQDDTKYLPFAIHCIGLCASPGH